MESQIARIKLKLSIAKKIDSKLEVFGASNHKYQLGKTLSEEAISSFEEEYEILLPECYRSFLKNIGNGRRLNLNNIAAAGPYYGIYPLGENVDELTEDPKKILKNKVIISPKLSDEKLKELFSPLEDLDNITDEEYDAEIEKLFSGILPIGTQGCSYFTAILLNGDFKGKIINIDLNMEIPHFCYEDNFLDWYERWLDEIISKDLISDKPTWFGYKKRESKSITSIEELQVLNKKHNKPSLKKFLSFLQN